MRAIVVDDEELAREAISGLLHEIEGITLIAECSDGIEAIKKVKSLNPDVLFLDIKMPQLDGFEVLELLGDDAPRTIFVTAFDEFAVKAFEANAVDYLLKPVSRERLQQSLEKLKSLDDYKIAYQRILREKEQKNKYLERILVRDGHAVHIIPAEEILWLEAQDDYVAIKTDNNLFLKLDRLSRLEERLNEDKFKRIHRSYIVNMDFVQRVEDQKWVILKSGKKLPVSKSGFTRFFGK